MTTYSQNNKNVCKFYAFLQDPQTKTHQLQHKATINYSMSKTSGILLHAYMNLANKQILPTKLHEHRHTSTL